MKKIENTIPVVGVNNLQDSIKFYTETLDFRLDWGGDYEGSTICSVSRDDCHIMLAEFARPGTWVWIGLEDESLFDVYKERGVKVMQEPKNWSWAYEMKFEDPDGNILWFGTEPRSDQSLVD